MKVRLFITGSCSTALGNWEHQLGNAAILIGLLRGIYKYLPDLTVATKYQLSEEFCQTYGIRSLLVEPERGRKIYRAAVTLFNLFLAGTWRFCHEIFRIDIKYLRSTRLLDAYYNSDIIIDLSGDTYGDNIPFKNFVKHSLDLLAARALGKPIVSLANSPGPFSGLIKKSVTRVVLNKIALITTREPVSTDLLRKLGVTTPIITTACPAFLLEPAQDNLVEEIMRSEGIDGNSRPIVGVTLAGYNLYSKPTWDVPETLEDLELYVPAVRFLLDELNAQVLLIPHVYRSNPWTGQTIHGPDYVILKTLGRMVSRYGRAERLKLIEGTYSPAEVKGLIGELDLHISGRLHAGVAALSQCVPTILLAYGHKHVGFMKMLNLEWYVWQPSMGPDGLLALVKQIWEERERVMAELHKWVPLVKKCAELNMKILRDMVKLDEKARVQIPKLVLNRWKSQGWEDRLLVSSAGSGSQIDGFAGRDRSGKK